MGYLVDIYFHSSWANTRRKIVGSYVVYISLYKRQPNSFPKWLHHLAFPLATYGVPITLCHILLPHCGFNLHLRNANDRFFLSAHLKLILLLDKYSFKSADIFTGFLFLKIETRNSVFIPDTISLSNTYLFNIFFSLWLICSMF